MKRITVFGVGEYADVAKHHFGPRCAAFTVHSRFSPTRGHAGLPVNHWETLEAGPLFIAVGNNRNRRAIYEEAIERRFELVDLVLVPPTAEYGKHCCILELNNIQPMVEIGNNCVIWSGNHIGHHTKIGNHVFITSHCVISGGCEIGDGVFLGVNCTILDHIKIGEGSIVQAGAVVDKDLEPNSVWTREGLSKVPAHKLKVA